MRFKNTYLLKTKTNSWLMTVVVICCVQLYSLPASCQGIIQEDTATLVKKTTGGQLLQNIPGRKRESLNGQWQCIIDPVDFGIGSWAAIWKDQKATGKSDFFEYSFDNATLLDVPGDFNSQLPELALYEGTIWYKKKFMYHPGNDKRIFIHFGAVNYIADVFLNSERIGSHEGGFTPFQFELTGKIKDGENSLIVRVNNQRISDGIPALGFDWFNYGGITREVNLVETDRSYVADYFLQLRKGSKRQLEGWVQVGGDAKRQQVTVEIPEAKINYKVFSDTSGMAKISFAAPLTLWSPENPKLYQVTISAAADAVTDDIGFRSIEVQGTNIMLNGSPVFLKGVNIHEEIPQRKGRAYSASDAMQLLGWAKELGCNFIRLAHYPQNEYMIRLAEKMGIMLWEEIPVYQGIAFADQRIQGKMNSMLTDMLTRDKNRCGIIIWSMSNETMPGNDRNKALINMATTTRRMDPTRLIASAFNRINYAGSVISIDDTLGHYLDVLSVNEYLGWYKPWPSAPDEVIWKSVFNKPLIMSEFGAEALYGNHGARDTASLWTEEYQEQVYKDQVRMLKGIPFLKGVCPWVLVDFRSPRRLHPLYQDGQRGMWNRKGLLSDRGFKKKAWYIMADYYATMPGLSDKR